MNKMSFGALIFDLDGTLWDSTQACAQAWNAAIDRLHIVAPKLSPQDVAKTMGMPIRRIMEKLFPGKTDAEWKKMEIELFQEEIHLIEEQGAVLFPGVQAGLIKLSEKFPLFIVSNCQQKYMDTFFSFTGLKPLFKDTECHGNTKMPKGENIRLVIQRNKLLSPAYIGDTASDQEAAELAQIPYFHVNYGFGTPARPCPSFDHFDILVEHFLTGSL